METVDVQKEVLEEVELLGRTGYFTGMRVDKKTVPEGMHCYELRHGDDWGFPVSVEENVRVNYFGAVLFTEALELGKEKALQFGYEDFGYTGEQMYLSQIIGGPEPFKNGKELAAFLGQTFPISEEEGQKLLDYMEGHDYLLGHMEGSLFRGDLCREPDKIHWEPDTIDDAVDAVSEWNYEMLGEAESAAFRAEDMDEFADKKRYLDTLREDEKILDGMFDRTKYGVQIEQMAQAIAGQLIQTLQSKGNIDGAVKELVQSIKGGQQEPAVQNTGRKKERVK